MARLKRLLHHIWIRSLKIDILTLFISLTTIAFIAVITYSYVRNYYAILNYSKGTMQRNSTAIIGDINDIQQSARETINGSQGLFIENHNFSFYNSQVQLYMLNVLKYNQNISSYFIAFANGSRILVKKLEASGQTHLIGQPEKPLPQGSTYCIKIFDPKRPGNPEIWYYLDQNFRKIGQEEFTKTTIPIKDRPWYIGALSTPKTFWTGPYQFIDTNERGITASKAIYTTDGSLSAVVGIDISFLQLTNFLSHETIGKYGHAFITDRTGQLLVPESYTLINSKINPDVIKAAILHYHQKNNNNFSFKFGHFRYLTYIGELPSIFGKDWLIVTIVPFVDFYSDLINTQFQIIGITLIILALSILVIIYFSKRISQPIVNLSNEIDKVTNLDLTSNNKIHSPIVEIRLIAASVRALRSAMRSFARYVPKEIVKQLLAQGKDITLRVDKRQLTIFFSDIQSFTSIAETEPLNTLMTLLNSYFDGLSKIILENQGTIDKYIGDSIMAFWGAPSPNIHQAVLACKTALECHAYLLEFNKNCQQQGKPMLITRFGISSGDVVVGNIGTKERMNYTVIGDAVNTAARLQVTDKIYHVNIIISEEVYHQTEQQFLVRPLDTVEVRGKKTKIKIYQLMASLTPGTQISATATQKELSSLFTDAYQKYLAGGHDEAKRLFQEIHQKFPEDYPTQIYLERLTT